MTAPDHFDFPSTLPLAPGELLVSAWDGVSPPDLERDVVIASTFPSAKSAGFVHYRVMTLRVGVETYSKRPFHPALVGFALDMMLKEHGYTAADLSWNKTKALAPDCEPVMLKPTAAVYFVQAVNGGLVKIGVSNDPAGRLASLQCGCPLALRIVKTIDGVARTREAEIHQQFAAYRVHGEWFDPIVLTMEPA